MTVDATSAAFHRSSRASCVRFVVVVAFGVFVVMPTTTAASVTFSCDASAPPEDGGVGDCTAALPEGDSCTPTCNQGFTLSRRHTECTPQGILESRCIPECDCSNRMITFGFAETPWTLLLTQTSGEDDIPGANNPFAIEISGSQPSTSTPYARDWTSVVAPETGDEFKLVRGSDGDFVTFVVGEWCGWNSTDAACGGLADTSLGFASGRLYDSSGVRIPLVRFFHTCFGVGCAAASEAVGFSSSHRYLYSETGVVCYGSCWSDGAVNFHWGSTTPFTNSPISFYYRPGVHPAIASPPKYRACDAAENGNPVADPAATLVLHLVANDVPDGGGSTWQDRSGARATPLVLETPSDAGSPILVDGNGAGFNGNKALRFGFDASASQGVSCLRLPTADKPELDMPSGSQGITVFVVLRPITKAAGADARATGEPHFAFDMGWFEGSGFGFSLAEGHSSMYTPTDHGGAFVKHYAEPTMEMCGVVACPAAPTVVAVRYKMQVNGVPGFMAAVGSRGDVCDPDVVPFVEIATETLDASTVVPDLDNVASSFSVGCQDKVNKDDRFFVGDIAELRYYSDALRDEDVHAIRNELARTYGIHLGTSRI
jgi:hypothetical protein